MTTTLVKTQNVLTGTGTYDVLYTVPASTETNVKEITFANVSGGNVVVSLWQGGHVAANLLHKFTVPANGTVVRNGNLLMDTASDTIEAEADTASVITATLWAAEFTA